MIHTILVLQNDPVSPLGVLEPVLRGQGFDLDVRLPLFGGDMSGGDTTGAASFTADLPESLTAYAGVIVLGGAMCALDDARYPGIGRILALLREADEASIPVLGLCLGGQLLARAHGGVVYRDGMDDFGGPEVGLTALQPTSDGDRDPILQGIGTMVAMELHHDRFDVPPGGVLLASSSACSSQAFRFGQTSWGFQFHPEVDPDIIRSWIDVLQKAGGTVNAALVAELEASLSSGIDASMDLGRIVAHRWGAVVHRQLRTEKTRQKPELIIS